MYLHGAMEFAVADCPPWAALMLLRHGASPTGYKCDLVTLLLNVARHRHPREGDVELLAALLQAGAPASSTAVCQLAELACDCNAAGGGLEAHIQCCRAMLSLLLQHGASLEVGKVQRLLGFCSLLSDARGHARQRLIPRTISNACCSVGTTSPASPRLCCRSQQTSAACCSWRRTG